MKYGISNAAYAVTGYGYQNLYVMGGERTGGTTANSKKITTKLYSINILTANGWKFGGELPWAMARGCSVAINDTTLLFTGGVPIGSEVLT